jgi:phage shock protein E
MLENIKKLFGFGPKVNYAELVANGAVIIDVRTKAEFSAGHIKGSVNIPVEQLGKNLNKIRDKSKPVITCCASGMRSASAKNFLKAQGYLNVHNGGAWNSLKERIK